MKVKELIKKLTSLEEQCSDVMEYDVLIHTANGWERISLITVPGKGRNVALGTTEDLYGEVDYDCH